MDTAKKKQHVSDTKFKSFIKSCCKELRDKGSTICFPIHKEELERLFPNVLKFTDQDGYVTVEVTKYVVTKYKGYIRKYPITTPINKIKGEVLSYE